MGAVSRDFIDDNPNVIDVGSAVPSNATVLPHNEMGYDRYYVPNYIIFGCFHPALQGGTTVISNVKQFTANLPLFMKEKFTTHGIRYQRILHNKNKTQKQICDALAFTIAYKSYQDYFQVQNKSDIYQHWMYKSKCVDIDFNLKDDCAIRISYTIDPFVSVETNEGRELLLINSVLDLHASYFDAFPIEKELEYNDRPTHCQWGNGEEFSVEELKTLYDLYNEQRIEFDLNEGDILVVNNLLWVHGEQRLLNTHSSLRKEKLVQCFTELYHVRNAVWYK
eukprot:1118786_1